jgi:hypothetical protein
VSPNPIPKATGEEQSKGQHSARWEGEAGREVAHDQQGEDAEENGDRAFAQVEDEGRDLSAHHDVDEGGNRPDQGSAESGEFA